MGEWDWLAWLGSLWWVWPLMAGGYVLGFWHGGMVGQARAEERWGANPWRRRDGRDLDETRYRHGAFVDRYPLAHYPWGVRRPESDEKGDDTC